MKYPLTKNMEIRRHQDTEPSYLIWKQHVDYMLTDIVGTRRSLSHQTPVLAAWHPAVTTELKLSAEQYF